MYVRTRTYMSLVGVVVVVMVWVLWVVVFGSNLVSVGTRTYTVLEYYVHVY